MKSYEFDITKFVEEPSLTAIAKIQEICEKNSWTENVPSSSKFELIRIRDGFARSYLELDSSFAEKGINKVCDAMRDTYPVRRVTFLYLLAEFTDTIRLLA